MSSATKQRELKWRRVQVLELASKGYNQREIATRLNWTRPQSNRDIMFLRQQTQDNLQKHIHEVVPEEYQKCMVGMKSILKKTLEIAETVTNPRVKLQAHAVAEDCYKYILEISTNAGIVSDALKYVTQQKEQFTSLQKMDDKIEEMNEIEPISDGVF